jgi:hypothetical protein
LKSVSLRDVAERPLKWEPITADQAAVEHRGDARVSAVDHPPIILVRIAFNALCPT